MDKSVISVNENIVQDNEVKESKVDFNEFDELVR